MRLAGDIIIGVAAVLIMLAVAVLISTEAKPQEPRSYTDNGQTYTWVVNADRSVTVTVDGKTLIILAADAEPEWYE